MILDIYKSFIMEKNHVTMVPARRETKVWEHQQCLKETSRCKSSEIIFVGASIISHFKGSDAWQKKFYNELNVGIGGDRTQHVLWRLQNMQMMPSTLKFAVLHCGTNNIGRNSPAEIAEGIKACSFQLSQMVPGIKIIIAAILPMDLVPTTKRCAILETNDILEELCQCMPNATYLPQNGWVDKNGVLETNLFRKDHLHLTDAGYAKFADQLKTTIESLNAIASPKSSSRRSKLPLRLRGTGHRFRHRCTNRYPQSSSPSPSPSPPTAHRPLHRRPLRPRPSQSRSHGPQRYHYPLSSSSSPSP